MEDEVTSINAIYGDGTLVPSPEDAQICILRLPSEAIALELRLHFPATYPDEPLEVTGSESVDAKLPKGAAKDVVDHARNIITSCFVPGEPCIYELVEQLLPILESYTKSAAVESGPQASVDTSGTLHDQDDTDTILKLNPPWVMSDPLTEKKSLFLARAAHVTHTSTAKRYVQHLLLTDKRSAKATHNITAWRIKGAEGVTYQDCDDDGETAAGGRLLHLMQIMDVWDVMVVVSRWYGGVHLGPARFAMINNVARDAIVRGGFDGEKC